MLSCNKNGWGKHFPYQELWEKYQDALETITYQQFRIHKLNGEVDGWCQAYEETVGQFESYKWEMETTD